MPTADVVIVGGGVIGLSVAWRVAQRGLAVTVVDPEPGRGASYAAAGMLAPVTEAHYGEEALLALGLASMDRYPDFVGELGEDVGYRSGGTLAVAFDAGDRAVLDELHAYHQRLGLTADRLTSREVRALEPGLAPTVRAGLLVRGDHAVDPRRLTPALLRAAERAGATLVRRSVREVHRAGDPSVGVVLDDGERVDAGRVVVAAGCWTSRLLTLPVRPVKGHILRLRGGPLLDRTVRGLVAGGSIYLVPRADGEVVVGATMEEMGYDVAVRAGPVHELLRDAHALVPGISELGFAEAHAGLRPATPDNAPIIGPVGGDGTGVVVASGHHRNGILLAPVTADAVAALLTTGALPPEAAPFTPDRFATVPA